MDEPVTKAGVAGGSVSFGPFRLLVAERLLKKGDEPLPLGGRALDILLALIGRAGEVVTQRELIEQVWPDTTVEDANLRVQLASVRKALGDGRESARYIVTVPGRGYSFVAPLTRSIPHHPSLSRDNRRRSLPPRLARMVGRDDTIRTVSVQLMTCRFLSVVGPGGIGKTTVAISVAHALLDEFDGAVFFVDLAALTDTEFVPTAIASALGYIAPNQDPLASLVAYISDKKILLVLDNCEHVMTIAASLAERVFTETPQAHILTTSREALRVEGEHVHQLYALECPPEDANLTAAEALKYPAAELFMERAAAAGYDTQLSDDEAPIVGTICRRLDGIALAMELAASRARVLGIRGVAELLDNRFGLVWRGRRTALPRHQTLNAMLDWSFNLLTEQEKAVLCRLSVFVGGFTLDAASSVVTEGELDASIAAEAIASLIAKSLVSTMAAHGSIYCRLLEMTRAFAATKLAQRGEATRVARRHAIFCSKLLRHDEIVESRFGQYDLSEYSVHIGNVRAALEWAFSEDGDLAVGVELAVGAAPLLVGLSLLTECVRWCERALASLNGGARGGQQEMILQEALGLSLMYTGGHSNNGRAAFERGLVLEEKIGDRQHHLQIFFSLYRLLLRRGEFRTALAMAEQGRTLAEATQDPGGLLVADFMLGAAHNYNGDQAAAQFYSERAMTRATELGAAVPNFFGFSYYSYGHVLLARCLALHGFADRARKAANAGLNEAMRREHPLSIILALHHVALIYLWIGDLRIANNHGEQLIDYVERHSIAPYRVAGLGLKGAIAVARNDNETGVKLLQSALEILSPKKLTFLLSGFMGALADGLRKMGQFEAALLTIDGAIAWTTETGIAIELADLLRIKAEILAAIPIYGRMSALSCLREAVAVARKQSALALELRSTVTLARFLSEGGERDQARQELSLVYGRFTEGFKTPDFTAARQLIEDLA